MLADFRHASKSREASSPDEHSEFWTFPTDLRPLLAAIAQIRDLLGRATSLKAKGNTEFGQGQGRWQMALETYREGLAELPPAPRKPASPSLKGKEKAIEDDGQMEQKDEEPAGTAAEQDEVRELRAILSANVAACLLKLVRLRSRTGLADRWLNLS